MGFLELNIARNDKMRITSLPLQTTNGMIVKQFNSDFTSTDFWAQQVGYDYPDGTWTDYFVLDSNSKGFS